jgi:hypothetical protein
MECVSLENMTDTVLHIKNLQAGALLLAIVSVNGQQAVPRVSHLYALKPVP